MEAEDKLKSGDMQEWDKLPEDARKGAVSGKVSSWVKDCMELDTGSLGGSGVDLAVGRYLKLEEQTPIDEATIEALRNKETTYWDHCAELQVSLSKKLELENGLIVDPQTEICLTSGITPAINTILSAFINPGDEVISMDPDFITTFGQIHSSRAKLVIAPAFMEQKGRLDESRWTFDPNGLEHVVTDKTKMVVFTNPNNPIGYVYSEKDLKAIADIAIRHDLIVLENECYERIVYGKEFYDSLKFRSLAALPGMKARTITVGGVSKGFHLSGYRLGWIIADPSIIRTMLFVQMWATFSMPPTISEFGVNAALSSPLREQYARHSLDIYRKNIDCLCGALEEIPQVECARPMGGPFCFMDVTNTGCNDRDFARKLYGLGVNTTFGCGWGKINSINHIRLALSNPPEYQEECVDKLTRAIREILK